MPNSLSKSLLWPFVIFLGITFGAGLYEARIVVSRWLTSPADPGLHWNPEAAQLDDTGRRFWAFISTIPLTLLTLANLIGSYRASGTLRLWWLSAAIFATGDRLMTFSYFIPSMVRLLRSEDSRETAMKALQWANLNYVRLAIVFAAWLAALRAFSLLYEKQG